MELVDRRAEVEVGAGQSSTRKEGTEPTGRANGRAGREESTGQTGELTEWDENAWEPDRRPEGDRTAGQISGVTAEDRTVGQTGRQHKENVDISEGAGGDPWAKSYA